MVCTNNFVTLSQRFEESLMHRIADLFNHSRTCQYFISYKKPKLIIEKYMFDAELIGQISTSMHGSARGHECYIFRRTSIPSGIDAIDIPCDPLFREAWETCKYGFDAVQNHTTAKIDTFFCEKLQRERKQPDRLGF